MSAAKDPGAGSRHSRLARRPLASARLQALADLLDPLTARVRVPELESLPPELDPRRPAEALATAIEALRAGVRSLDRLRARADRLRGRALALDEAQRPELVAEHLRELVDEPDRLRADLGAVARGQLDLACLLEREGAAAEAEGARVEVLLRLLAPLADRAAELSALRAEPGAVVQVLRGHGAFPLLATLVRTEPRRPSRLAAAAALVDLLRRHALPWGLGAESLHVVQELLDDDRADPWLRRALLPVAEVLPAPEAAALLGRALARAQVDPDGALVRARVVEVLLAHDGLDATETVRSGARDESELVRFTLADGVAARLARGWPTAAAEANLLAGRADARTRARLAWALGSAGPAGLALLPPRFQDEPLVARTALEAAVEAARRGEPLQQALVEAAAAVPADAPPGVRRRARVLLHQALATHNPAGPAARELASLARGASVELRLPPQATALDLARCLVPLADRGFGFVLDPDGGPDRPGARVRVSRGDQPAPALWRLLDEARNPAPAKRQAHTHATGRADLGPVRVPSTRLAEATPTGVPGQQVLVERLEGWAPEVPMVDDLLHAARHGEVLLVTPEGTTRVQAPRGPARLWARLRAAWSYRRLDTLRLAALDTEDTRIAQAWDAALADLGFRVQREEAPSSRGGAWIDPLSFAISMSGSSLSHLGLVVLLLAALLFGRLSWARHQLRQARAALPLVLGGWGTRGKSGTERLKAGLFEALGIPFVSKTTGCEAMILHAPPGGRARELFLYRPYDKATIWEQAEVAMLGPRLGARVLLWECMALNPRYVELLQTWWMRDDLSTLTNAFPDHEDIQGPTGQDVAEVIAGFAPEGGPVFTTEEGMLPVMEEVGRQRGAEVIPVPRAAHELLPRDLLARFRHREHPANVALVVALAAELGIPAVEAVGFMAERVVADVGALVVHVPVPTEARLVTFAQGQSANDPLSFRHSWRTAGFEEEPCPPWEWRVSVVNNRADRVARSKMFAGLLADTASAHRHVLIGTNLQGLRSYLSQAVQARLARTDLESEAAVARIFGHLRIVEPAALGEALGERLGIAVSERVRFQVAAAALPPASAPTWAACQQAAQHLRPAAARLAAAMPTPLSPWAEDLVEHLVQAAARHLALQAALRGQPADRAALYRALVEASLVVVEDSKATGDQVIDRAVRSAPPGAHVRLMGLQNIKGTGLDFAYRWVEWGEVSALLERLGEVPEDERRRRMGTLGTRAYGCAMVCDGVLATLDALPDAAEVEGVRAHVQRARQALVQARIAGKGKAGPLRRALDVLERILDPFHGIWRRRRARHLLGELGEGRISHDAAQRALHALVDVQKGGWLRGR
ncbi:hypothetical protein L6R53_29785 [Myxococcota bacterium]|nr:hypothetical protein [Myxococcota bacterium]